jgi:hypothetical protein
VCLTRQSKSVHENSIAGLGIQFAVTDFPFYCSLA